eukprot:m.426822 g.426822  ORF g.426822 m.426822 type:complete len:317 (+) comp21359_c0_seq2:763-1713(+)
MESRLSNVRYWPSSLARIAPTSPLSKYPVSSASRESPPMLRYSPLADAHTRSWLAVSGVCPPSTPHACSSSASVNSGIISTSTSVSSRMFGCFGADVPSVIGSVEASAPTAPLRPHCSAFCHRSHMMSFSQCSATLVLPCLIVITCTTSSSSVQVCFFLGFSALTEMLLSSTLSRVQSGSLDSSVSAKMESRFSCSTTQTDGVFLLTPLATTCIHPRLPFTTLYRSMSTSLTRTSVFFAVALGQTNQYSVGLLVFFSRGRRNGELPVKHLNMKMKHLRNFLYVHSICVQCTHMITIFAGRFVHHKVSNIFNFVLHL